MDPLQKGQIWKMKKKMSIMQVDDKSSVFIFWSVVQQVFLLGLQQVNEQRPDESNKFLH